jgi:hypothetical protein
MAMPHQPTIYSQDHRMPRASSACVAIPLLLLFASCSDRSPEYAAYMPPPLPKQPPAPWCARPTEINAFHVAALKSNLMVIALKCSDNSRYNDFVVRHRQGLLRNEAAADGYFSRNNRRHWQQSRDQYITNLANAQSQRATVMGDQYCRVMQGSIDDVLALSAADLPGYAESKTQSIPQAMEFNKCPTDASTPGLAPRRSKRQTVRARQS